MRTGTCICGGLKLGHSSSICAQRSSYLDRSNVAAADKTDRPNDHPIGCAQHDRDVGDHGHLNG